MSATPETQPINTPVVPAQRTGFLNKLGLHRPELRAWALYDFGNSAFITTIITAVFPIYYSKVASAGIPTATSEFRFSMATTAAMVVIALLAPLLGTMADVAPIKKKMIAGFVALGVTAVGLMFFVGSGGWLLALGLFMIANLAANGSFVFYDALLPHVASGEEMDRVSTAGYALGYVGGGVLLAFNLMWITHPDWFCLPSGENLAPDQKTLPTRLAFLSVAIWWLVFTIPLLRRVKEPPVRLARGGAIAGGSLRAAVRQLSHSFSELRKFRNAFLMLLAFLIYNDGIGTIIRMASIYGSGLGIGTGEMIAAILITQFVGIPFAFLFGILAGKIGAKRSIFLGLLVYAGISVLGYNMKTARDFLILAILVGMVQGGAQALSRSLFASMIPRHKAGEFFGFFAVVEKFAGILGPLLFGVIVAISGSSRNAILSVIAFFVIGGILLLLVNVEEGQKLARTAERAEKAEEQPAT
jgi:UMF1 family MFS transporter